LFQSAKKRVWCDYEVDDEIAQTNEAKRTGQSKDYRMQKEHQPAFTGKVEAGSE
jgi:hypothetical protein